MENCLKVVVLGGDSVGKTSLILVKTKHKYPYRRVPRLADPTIVRTRIDGKSYTFSVWDTEKIERCEQLHSTIPSHTTDVFMLCFAVDNRQSFNTLTHKWLPQLKASFPFVPTVLVACKIDLRYYPSVSTTANHVTFEEGNAVAEQHGCLYCETSALSTEGVTECFKLAVRYADLNLDKRENSAPICPCVPSRSRSYMHIQMVKPADIPPEFEIESSTFSENWLDAFKDGSHFDVTFLLQEQQLMAHQVVLCSASGYFCRLFQTEKVFTSIPSPVVSFTGDQESRHTTIQIDSSISPEVFKIFIEFLYTGSVSQLNKEQQGREIAMDLINVARMFELTDLKSVCENILNERDFLNPSLGSAVCDKTGQRMRDLFFNCVDTADVVFILKGKRLYANKVILSTRCEVMRRMFSGNFKESKPDLTEIEIPNFTPESFLSFLEYMYSDHANFENVDVFEVLKLADMYCQKRLLSMCEYCIARKAQGWTLKKRADLVFQILLGIQPFNTANLVNWCLFELSRNVDKLKNHKDYCKLTEENRRIVEARGSLHGHRGQSSTFDPNAAYRRTCVII